MNSPMNSFVIFQIFKKSCNIQLQSGMCKTSLVSQRLIISPSLHSKRTPAGIYLLKINNRSHRTRYPSGGVIVNFERNSHLVLVFLLLTSNR